MPDLSLIIASIVARILAVVSRHEHELLFMSGATWAQLWSGIFGAVFGAMAAAAVALLVVWLSNRHQKRLAEAAMREQQRLAGEALTEQKRLAGEALAEQRNLAAQTARSQAIQYQRELLEQRQSLRLQLDEQRLEASKARQQEAIAEAMAAVSALIARHSEGLEQIDTAVQSMRAAVFRWGFEHPDRSEVQELNRWPHHLALLGYAALQAERTRPPTDADFDILNSAANIFLTLVSGWPSAATGQRTKLIRALQRARLAPSANHSVAELFAD